MARKKSDGEEIRNLNDGPVVEHDDLIDQIEARAREQHARSSDASESAAKVAAFIEKTGLNSQAFSWLSSIIKKLPKKDGQAKAMDIIRSLEAGLPMIKAHVAGQGTAEMNLGGDDAEEQSSDDENPDAEPDVDQVIADGEPSENVVTPLSFGGAE